MYQILFLLVAATHAFQSGRPSGLPAKCPTPAELQSTFVKSYFDDSKMNGFWYELAMKDATQPRMCKCQTSEKSLDHKINQLNDGFRIQCAGKVYYSNLTFALTDVAGVSVGTWNGIPGIDKIEFPNTVVDVGVHPDTGDYEWMIEFQCVDGKKINNNTWIAFYAFNFYSKSYENSAERIQIMEESARKHGLSAFIDSGRDMKIIDHTDCLHGH